MTINDNPIDPTLLECNEDCCLFRWSKCETKNKDGICDKPDRYDHGEEFYPEMCEIKVVRCSRCGFAIGCCICDKGRRRDG